MDETSSNDNRQDDQSPACIAAELQPRHLDGVYSLPVVGRPLRQVRDICDGLRPAESDSIGVRTGKQVARCGLVALATGVTAIAVF